MPLPRLTMVLLFIVCHCLGTTSWAEAHRAAQGRGNVTQNGGPVPLPVGAALLPFTVNDSGALALQAIRLNNTHT